MSHDVAWFDRTPGEFPSGTVRAAVVETESGPAVLVGDLSRIDWVRLPPELGGGEARVLGSFRGRCPKHELDRWGEEGSTLIRDVGKYLVAECATCGFVVFSFGDP